MQTVVIFREEEVGPVRRNFGDDGAAIIETETKDSVRRDVCARLGCGQDRSRGIELTPRPTHDVNDVDDTS